MYSTNIIVLVALFCITAFDSKAQKFVDVSAFMKMPLGSYLVDTTGYSSIEHMDAGVIAERSWANLGFVAAIPTIYDPAPALSVRNQELPRDSMFATTDAGRFLYDTMFAAFGFYTWIFQDRDTTTGYTAFDVRFDNLIRCLEFNEFFLDLKYGMMGTAVFPDQPLGVSETVSAVTDTRHMIEIQRSEILTFSTTAAINSRVCLYGLDGRSMREIELQQDGINNYRSIRQIDCAFGQYFLCDDRSLIAIVFVR